MMELGRTGRPTTLALRGMVASPNYLASQAGLRLLQEGGNAVDAAVATAAALAVVYPHNTTAGGDLFALVYDAAGGAVHALNASGRAAELATIGFYASRGHTSAIPSRGPLSALTVPGAVDGWFELLGRFGRKEPGQVLAPAIDYAERGFPVSSRLAVWFENDRQVLSESPSAKALFCPDGRPPRHGERLAQPNLARTLRSVAERGRDLFYRGPLAEQMAAALASAGSPLRASDFAAHRSDWQEPLSVDYRGQTLYQVGPNSQGIVALQIAGIAAGWDLQAFGEGTTAYYHHLIEATRQAFGDRDRYLTDPDFFDIPIPRLLSQEHAAILRAAIDSRRAGGSTPAPVDGDTVCVCAADEAGNLVSLIQSIYWDFGSAFVAGESGVLFQNRGSFFSLDPDHPNRLEPGKRTFHTLIPALLARDGRPWLAYGTMGGEGQPQTQTALLTRIVDFGFDLQAAVEAPRWLLGRTWGAPSSALHLEGRIPASVAEELRAIGHPVSVAPSWSELFGHAQAVAVDRQLGILRGGSDPRSDGAAIGI